MPTYDFECPKCGALQSLTCGMNETEKRNNVNCTSCGSKMSRVFSVPSTIIKTRLGSAMKLAKNQAVVDIDGKPVRLNFLDHGSKSGIEPGSAASRFPGARIDEKTGRPVMDVVSTVKDPLGKLEAAKRRGNVEVIKKNVNQRYKLKKGARR